MATILITGGSGMIGSRLIPLLQQKDHTVHVLSHSGKQVEGVRVFEWDIERNHIEKGAFEGVHHIIHLSGFPIAQGRWTTKRRQLIRDSRIKAVALLRQHLPQRQIESFISASGISIYGSVTTDTLFDEEHPIAVQPTDFAAQVALDWERAAVAFADRARRTVVLRTPVVLSSRGGALERISKPIRRGIGATLGSGRQYVPWVHEQDVCAAYVHAVETPSFSGTYNLVAPEHVTNYQLTTAIANVLKRKIWRPIAPAIVLKMMFGEMANMVLKGSRVSGKKITETGYNYRFERVEQALRDLWK